MVLCGQRSPFARIRRKEYTALSKVLRQIQENQQKEELEVVVGGRNQPTDNRAESVGPNGVIKRLRPWKWSIGNILGREIE